jgi:hypothetical protein
LTITPEEVVRCLFSLEYGEIVEAIKHLDEEQIDAKRRVPWLLKAFGEAILDPSASDRDERNFRELRTGASRNTAADDVEEDENGRDGRLLLSRQQ